MCYFPILKKKEYMTTFFEASPMPTLAPLLTLLLQPFPYIKKNVFPNKRVLPLSYRHPLTRAIERGKPAYTVRGPHPHELTPLPFLHLDILHQHLKIKRANKSVHSSFPLCIETLGQEPLKMGELLLVQRPHPLKHNPLWKI